MLSFTADSSQDRAPVLMRALCDASGAPALARDASFIELLNLYRRFGGLAREVEVLSRISRLEPGPLRSCPDGFEQAIRFDWQGWTWLPLFQFDLDSMALRPMPRAVIEELGPVFDGCAKAQWFAMPNGFLRDLRPIDVLDEQPRLVLEAARADRLVMAG